MKCFRHEPGEVCPECGLDRRMRTPKEIIEVFATGEGDSIILALEKCGYKIMQNVQYPHTIEHERAA